MAGGRRGKDDRKKYIDSVAREDWSRIQFITVVILEICRQKTMHPIFFMGRRVRDVRVQFTFCTNIHQFAAVWGFSLVHQGFSKRSPNSGPLVQLFKKEVLVKGFSFT